jgi:hypothetical protein
MEALLFHHDRIDSILSAGWVRISSPGFLLSLEEYYSCGPACLSLGREGGPFEVVSEGVVDRNLISSEAATSVHSRRSSRVSLTAARYLISCSAGECSMSLRHALLMRSGRLIAPPWSFPT